MANELAISQPQPGSADAAMLLLMLGEERAAEVLRYVGSEAVEKIGVAMAGIREVNNDQALAVIDGFGAALSAHTPLGVGVPDYVRQVLVSTLGEEQGRTLADRVLGDSQPVEIDTLRWLDFDTVVHMLRDEHPQIIAITLAHMEPAQAATILDRLEAGLQEDVVLRIATMEKIPQAALMELQTILRSKLSLAGAFKARPVDGARTVAGIINGVGSGTEGRIIEALSKVDRSLTEKIQDLMFVFDNLIGLDDKSMQVLLREVSNDVLALALKGAVEPMREKVFRNMSKRAGEILQEDMEARGPVKMSEVEVAQKEIVTVARRLSEEGQITLATGREDYVE
ncbi:flagellar motor switch protein FliG [Amnimonas aquatica]|uniref:Flagellar motor switch protein FliG n=1 Tax=Amnimonas aquatica TaxID=2094561 RepID=A0A2P6AS13_9GAMM|nr:flagellar motor switch protein FliG [Amnimonas aquatica]PQA40719.1 flagellar motor switch protein FliG [Amnimonas aquatica]